MKFAAIPDAPACFTMSAEHGTPEPALPPKQLLMVSGNAYLQMSGPDQVHTLKPGAFVTVPPKHAHHFTCASASPNW